jgi:hypothetical protein
MTMLRLLWHDYRYFPYERMLAEREAKLLFRVTPQAVQDGLVVRGLSDVEDIGTQLTYFKAIQSGEHVVVPDQAKLEASGNGNGSTWDPAQQPIPSLRRQSTRYSAHGLHEYRGKFNPQVVRAIGNLMNLPKGAWVLDPFCGSGTTLLEAAHIGWNCLGVDINPLAILIANAKVAAFNTAPEVLSRASSALAARLSSIPDGRDWRERLPDPRYLEKWFPLPVLEKLHAILRAIGETRPAILQDVFRVILSDICREVSFQDPGDLRIRRRKDVADDYPVVELFLKSLQTKVGSVVRARQHLQRKEDTAQHAIYGDIRDAVSALTPSMQQRKLTAFDAAITSPPYATAMPYLDTQRLSLSLLGLMASRKLRDGEKRLIGNREIQHKQRLSLEGNLHRNTAHLPDNVIAFCRRLLALANDAAHGFRRRNVPALLYKYLADMSCMFASVRSVMRAKGRYALLVGRNATTLKGEEVFIDTPSLLASVAESRGWQIEETLTFDTYQRYDVHQTNSIREEVLILLRAT